MRKEAIYDQSHDEQWIFSSQLTWTLIMRLVHFLSAIILFPFIKLGRVIILIINSIAFKYQHRLFLAL